MKKMFFHIVILLKLYMKNQDFDYQEWDDISLRSNALSGWC